ncbi:hypothetical protein ACHAWF_018177 [Thalassiosira exigua]
MASFLARVANEAAAALSDAYGHVVHGDDAGVSARVVWVVHPARVPTGGAGGTAAAAADAADATSPGGRDGGPATAGGSGGCPFTQKFGEVRNRPEGESFVVDEFGVTALRDRKLPARRAREFPAVESGAGSGCVTHNSTAGSQEIERGVHFVELSTALGPHDLVLIGQTSMAGASQLANRGSMSTVDTGLLVGTTRKQALQRYSYDSGEGPTVAFNAHAADKRPLFDGPLADLGLTFIEINDRAYVRTVDPGSAAERAGVQPRDCVQLACVAGGPRFDDLLLPPRGAGPSPRNNPASPGGARKARSVEAERDAERLRRLDARASRYALERERRGARTGYEELRELFGGCTLPPRGDGSGDNNNNSSGVNGVPNVVTPPRCGSAPRASSPPRDAGDDLTLDSNSLLFGESAGGTFEPPTPGRRGRPGREDGGAVSSRRVPAFPEGGKVARDAARAATDVARTAAGRCFEGADDGDDLKGFDEDGAIEGENRDRAKGGAWTGDGEATDTPRSPVIDDPSLRAPRRGEGALAQSLYPVVMVFRRTVQRKRAISAPSSSSKGDQRDRESGAAAIGDAFRGWGSPGLSLGGSLFGIPSFRMDDECDRAAALIRQLAPGEKGGGLRRVSGGAPTTPRFDGEASAGSQGTSSKPASENIEAATIRGMLNHAVGLGFVRISKVVVGVSLQGGSGILVARLPDGTWSAPSAMGVCGLGLGLQFGLEVADFMFIIQTPEGMDHFRRGGNFVVGGNIGAAVANCGREAYGAASLGACTGRINLADHIGQDEGVEDDGTIGAEGGTVATAASSARDETSTYQSGASTLQSYHERGGGRGASSHQSSQRKNASGSDVAPVVAYAKSQGLYFGVSVDGLKFFTRNDINARTYKFSVLGEMRAEDILGGLAAPPPEAEDLYAALYSVEYAHDMTELPQPPEMLLRDAMNDWRFDRSIAAVGGDIVDTDATNNGSRRSRDDFPPSPYSFLSSLSREEADRFALFETKFKKFLYGGVTVQHLMPNSTPMNRSGMTRRQKRTLWLMLPEIGSLRLGFVSKEKGNGGGGDAASAMDDITVASSIASSMTDAEDFTALTDAGNVKLSKKYSMSLTDVTTLSQEPSVTIRLSPDDATEHLRILSLQDVTGKSMLFLANSNREAELLFCGLKLLLECETERLSVRGGVPVNQLGGKLGKGALSPLSARGSSQSRSNRRDRSDAGKNHHVTGRVKEDLDDRSKYSSFGEPGTSSDESNDEEQKPFHRAAESANLNGDHQVPEGRQSWSQLPGRSAMRQMASGVASPRALATPHYELGKAICTDIATNISLPIPLALCRVAFLDSSSPVNKTWEKGRVDSDYRHGAWAFPPGSRNDFERNAPSSEQQLISRGSMAGAQRTVSYSRTRNGELVRLSETITVEHDNEETLEFAVADQMPRRGFAAKARLCLRSFDTQSCEARIVTEIRPVGKNLSDQLAVHKAFLLVLDQMKRRYGAEGKGLLAVFLDVYNSLPGYGISTTSPRNPASPRSQAQPPSPSSRSQTSFGNFPGNQVENSTSSHPLPGNSSPNTRSSTALPSPSQISPRRNRQNQMPERPSTPSMRTIDSKTVGLPNKAVSEQKLLDDFADFSNFEDIPRNPVTVEVKPLPKIRLDLCPVPLEEDEEEDVSVAKHKRKSKHSRHKKRRPKHRSAK